MNNVVMFSLIINSERKLKSCVSLFKSQEGIIFGEPWITFFSLNGDKITKSSLILENKFFEYEAIPHLVFHVVNTPSLK